MDEVSIDHHLSMWNPVNRKKSYKKWPFNSRSSCSVTKMTAAGFYHVPDPIDKDTARCFYCCRTICGFEEGDDPIEEHLRRSKDCKYAKYGNIKDLQSSVTLFEYSQFEAERKDNYISYMREHNPELKRDRSPSPENLNSQKRVRVSLSRNSCFYFKSNSSLDHPAPFEAEKEPVKSVYKTPPTPAPDQEISDSRRHQISDITKRISL